MKKIYVHGLGQTAISWEKMLKKIGTAQESECINLIEVLQGNKATYENIYKAFSNVCNNNSEPISLCGLSLGGVLALNYAIDYPKKVSSLVLIGTQYKMPKNVLRFQNMLFRFMPKGMFETMGFGKKDFVTLCRTMMNLDFTDSLSKINCPVLIICGEKDNANKRASVKLADILKNAKLQLISNAGHEINTEAPEELAKVLRSFYESL